MPIIDPKSWPVVKGGEALALYTVRPGVRVKLTKAQARARGYLAEAERPEAQEQEPVTKRRAPVANKKRAPAPNKAAVVVEDEDDEGGAEDGLLQEQAS